MSLSSGLDEAPRLSSPKSASLREKIIFEPIRLKTTNPSDSKYHSICFVRTVLLTGQQRIQQRGRDYEQDISTDYLTQLNKLYEDWINDFNLCPILTVPADDLDFVKPPGHRDLIIQKVEQKLTGKDEVVFNSEEVANGRM